MRTRRIATRPRRPSLAPPPLLSGGRVPRQLQVVPSARRDRRKRAQPNPGRGHQGTRGLQCLQVLALPPVPAAVCASEALADPGCSLMRRPPLPPLAAFSSPLPGARESRKSQKIFSLDFRDFTKGTNSQNIIFCKIKKCTIRAWKTGHDN